MKNSIPFKLTLVGTIDAWSEDHAKDVVNDLAIYLRRTEGCKISYSNIEIGDDHEDWIDDWRFRQILNRKYVESSKKIFQRFLDGTAELIPPPPMIFDRTNYNEVREKLNHNFDMRRMQKIYEEEAEGFANSVGEELLQMWSERILKYPEDR